MSATNATALTSIVEIRSWILSVNSLRLEQFAIDWIEKYVDRANEILMAEGIMNTDEDFRRAIHYEARNVLEVLRPDAGCHWFFVNLESLTKERP